MARLLRGARVRERKASFSRTRTPKLLKSLTPNSQLLAPRRADFAITAGTSALAIRPGRTKRIANTVSYKVGRGAGAANRMARRGFNAVRTRIPGGVKSRLKGIGRKAIAVVSRVRRPRVGV